MFRSTRAKVALATILTVGLFVPTASPAQSGVDLEALDQRYQDYLRDQGQFLCGTAQAMFPELRRESKTAEGTPVFFDQDPPILTSGYRGAVTFRNFTVVGDIPKLTFEPSIFDTNSPAKKETWKRKRTATVDGVKVSIFEPTWDSRQVDRFFYAKFTGFDRPGFWWGKVSAPGGSRLAAGKADYTAVRVRVAPSDLPDVQVKTIDGTASYSASVVNLVIPGFGHELISESPYDNQDTEISRVFYKYFRDVYQALAVIPRPVHIPGRYFAFHRLVANSVQGIGLGAFDRTAEYGSAGTLQGAEYYPDIAFGYPSTTTHELAHQWGHFFDWGSIAGISRAGHQPSAHTPLIDGGETLIGAVLEGEREVVSGEGRARANSIVSHIGAPDAPYRYHPLTLYAMGWLRPDQVPDLEVFVRQDQFNPDSSDSPDVGTAVVGGTVRVTIDDIIRVEGKRKGPKAPRKWKRATVVVSRDQPLTQDEWNYWTWLTQRQTYRNKDAGVTSWMGYGPYRQATGGKLSLQSDVEPRSSAKIKQKLRVGFPSFSTNAWRGFQFDKKIPTKIKAGQRIDLSGRVTANDRSNFDSVLLSFSRYDPTSGDRLGRASRESDASRTVDIDLYFDVDANGRFRASYTFGKNQTGRYMLSAFLFWPGSGSQYSRSSRGTLTVQ